MVVMNENVFTAVQKFTLTHTYYPGRGRDHVLYIIYLLTMIIIYIICVIDPESLVNIVLSFTS